MTIRERLNWLTLLINSKTRQLKRLPLGRCACHEPSVKWCTVHGEPADRRSRRKAA